ncbi:uncharacterized protein LOC115666904 [Syzygium oleosum]|uniref:uncharacterized protein LOC115666904 n=1 Tax=Syzygium oleosum TaxID=219896 RepID=UPI0011D19DC2|nr:uncharacterized protein LOC115666904 [Syzygium oleosum]
MTDQNEQTRVAVLETEMKQVLNVLENLTKQVTSLQTSISTLSAPTQPSVEIVLPDDSPPVESKDKGKTVAIGTSSTENGATLTDKARPIITDGGDASSKPPKSDEAERIDKLEEKFRQMQGFDDQFSRGLAHIVKVQVPKKFKAPEFNKFDGLSCPKVHLQYYTTRMAPHADNVPLMIHTFQDSLTGPPLQWFVLKKIHSLKTWEDLSDAFIRQYKFNIDVAPSREDLIRTEKKKTETFKAYATRWRALAVQITPELTEKEMLDTFMKTLPFEFRNRMLGSNFNSLAELIPVGERIEIALRDGWATEQATSAKKFTLKKDKEPTPEVNVTYSQQSRDTAPTMQSAGKQQGGRQFTSRQQGTKRNFTPLPGPLSKVLPVLQKKNLLSSEPKRPNPERFSGYDSSKKCEYHMGEVGHSTDDCYVLKHRIQDLLDTKAFSFRSDQPNVERNPLPNHVGSTDAVIE